MFGGDHLAREHAKQAGRHLAGELGEELRVHLRALAPLRRRFHLRLGLGVEHGELIREPWRCRGRLVLFSGVFARVINKDP